MIGQDIRSVLTCRPVDCNSGSLLNYDPGFVNSTIYSDHMEAGWGYHLSDQPQVTASLLDAQGAGINNSTAICATLPPGARHCQTLSLCMLSQLSAQNFMILQTIFADGSLYTIHATLCHIISA